MLRKLIMLAITTTLAKKAYDKYAPKSGAAAPSDAVTDVKPRKTRAAKPSARARGDKPSAS